MFGVDCSGNIGSGDFSQKFLVGQIDMTSYYVRKIEVADYYNSRPTYIDQSGILWAAF